MPRGTVEFSLGSSDAEKMDQASSLSPNSDSPRSTSPRAPSPSTRRTAGDGSTSLNSFTRNLLLLFDRPREPIFLPKGDRKMIFVLPQNFYIDNYRGDLEPIKQWIDKENLDQKIMVKELKKMPDMRNLTQIGPEDNFSFFYEKHRQVAAQLVSLFLNAENEDELMVRIIFNIHIALLIFIT